MLAVNSSTQAQVCNICISLKKKQILIFQMNNILIINRLKRVELQIYFSLFLRIQYVENLIPQVYTPCHF